MTTMEDKFENFQAGAGIVGSELNVIQSYAGAAVLALIAVIIGWIAFIPQDTFTNTEKKCVIDQDCIGENQSCVNKMCLEKSKTKKHNYWLLIISVVLLCIAYFIVWQAKMIKKVITQDKNTQKVGGLLFASSLISNLLKNKNR
jgi:hypothetical protein